MAYLLSLMSPLSVAVYRLFYISMLAFILTAPKHQQRHLFLKNCCILTLYFPFSAGAPITAYCIHCHFISGVISSLMSLNLCCHFISGVISSLMSFHIWCHFISLVTSSLMSFQLWCLFISECHLISDVTSSLMSFISDVIHLQRLFISDIL